MSLTKNLGHYPTITRQLRAKIHLMADHYHTIGHDVPHLWLRGLERDLDTLLSATQDFTTHLPDDFRPT